MEKAINQSNEQIIIRRAVDADSDSILRVHHDAVHMTAAQNYESDILNEWASPLTPQRIENHRAEFQKSKEELIFIVAEVLDQVIGFGMYVPSTGEISAIYVLPGAGRKGVGALLLCELENIAHELGANQVWLQATLNAEKFYLRNGFIRESMAEYTFPSGLKMSNIKMYKNL